jgi:hypothetical protein
MLDLVRGVHARRLREHDLGMSATGASGQCESILRTPGSNRGHGRRGLMAQLATAVRYDLDGGDN